MEEGLCKNNLDKEGGWRKAWGEGSGAGRDRRMVEEGRSKGLRKEGVRGGGRKE